MKDTRKKNKSIVSIIQSIKHLLVLISISNLIFSAWRYKKQIRVGERIPQPRQWNQGTDGISYYFMDYYVSSQLWDKHKVPQSRRQFNVEVNRFKDWGNSTMFYAYAEAIMSLNRPDVFVIFMPCSTEVRYQRRWSDLATYLHHFGIRVGLNLVHVTHSREIAHFNKIEERETSKTERNYTLSIPEGSACVIVDDVRTTGASIRDLATAIKENGSKVIGAVVMGQSFPIV